MPKSKNSAQTASALKLFIKSKDLVLKNLRLFVFLNLTTLAYAIWQVYDRVKHTTGNSGWSLGNSVSNSAFGPSFKTPGHLGAAVVAIFVVAAVLLTLSLTIASVMYTAGKKPSIKEIGRLLLDKGLGLFAVTVFTALAFLGGIFALVIPGIYLIGRLNLAIYAYAYEDTTVVDAIKTSWHITNGHMWSVYSLLLLSILFSLTAIVPIAGPIVSFVLALLFSAATAYRYHELKALAPAA